MCCGIHIVLANGKQPDNRAYIFTIQTPEAWNDWYEEYLTWKRNVQTMFGKSLVQAVH